MVGELLDRDTAQTYASWLRPWRTRTGCRSWSSWPGRPADERGGDHRCGLAQSTVFQHLKILPEVRFVFVEPVGTARHYRINDACFHCFPSATDVVMGRPALSPIGAC